MLELTTLGWILEIGLIVRLFAFDVGLSSRRPHVVGCGEAVGWSVFYVAIAVAFGVVFGIVADWDLGAQYFSGYIVEKSLSVDNVSCSVIMSSFAVPPEHQRRTLTIGIAFRPRACGRSSSLPARRCSRRSRSCCCS